MTVVKILIFVVLSVIPLAAQDSLKEAADLFSAGQYAKAALIYERLQVADETNYEATMGLGRSLFMQHEGNRSLALFEKAEHLAPESAEPWLWQAKVLQRRGEIDLEKEGVLARATLSDAHRSYEQALSKDPKLMPALLGATRVLFQLLRLDEALAMVDRVLAIDPDHEAGLITRLGLLYRLERWGDFLAACKLYEDKIAIDLTHVLNAECQLGRQTEVHATLIRMFDAGYSGSYRPFEILSLAWSEGERLQQQVALLRDMLVERPDEKAALFYLGYAELKLGRLSEARQAYEAYERANPSSVATRTNLARIAKFEGRLDDAITGIKDVLEQDPNYETARTELQEIVGALVEAKRLKEALSLHEVLFELDPDNSFIVRGHAILLKEVGELEKAVELLRLLIDEYPIETSRLASYTNDYGLTLKALGRVDEAKEAFNKAIALWDREADARENLGVVLFDAGQFAAAQPLFEAAIQARLAVEGLDLSLNLRSRYYLGRIKSGRNP